MYGYIYKTTNLINNKIYIGQHKHNKNDKIYLGSGLLLNKAINKYGINNFKCEILEECESKKILNQQEIYWIAKLKPEYNIAKGGTGGDTFFNKSYNERKIIHNKISNSLKEAYKKGRSKKGNTGHHHTLETKQKIANSISKKEKNRMWITNGEIDKIIYIKDFKNYLGWKKGRTYRNKDFHSSKMTKEIKLKISETLKKYYAIKRLSN